MAKTTTDAEKTTETEAAMVAPAAPARDDLHVGLYGEPHVGKSTMAATFPTPMYVAFFDRGGKDLAYVKVWRKRFGVLEKKDGKDKLGTEYTDYFAKGTLVGRIARYATAIVAETNGISRFQEYFAVLEKGAREGRWATIVADSVTFMTYDARKESQYVLNPRTKSGSDKNTLAWYGHATDQAEEILMSLIPNLSCNTIAIMHESKVLVEAEGGMVRSPSVPGKRLASTNAVAATFPELYRLYAERADDGKKRRFVQTDSDERWQAGSVIGAPDACKPTYEALWVNWESDK